MKMSEQYWNAACDLADNILPDDYFELRDLAGITGDQMINWASAWKSNGGTIARAFLFFMIAEEHRIHGK